MKGDGSGWDQLDTGFSDDEDEEESASWSEKDKELISPVVNIIKGAKVNKRKKSFFIIFISFLFYSRFCIKKL